MARRKRLPVEPFSAQITALNAHGYGLTEHGDRALKVFGALPGETVTARFRFGRQFKGQAEVVEIDQSAPGRVQPRCPYFGVCGACALQHMDHAAQLEFKQDLLLKLLADNGHLVPGRVLPPLAAEEWHYRRKARLSVRDVPGKGRVLVGFREQDNRFVVDMRECSTLAEPIARQLAGLSDLLGSMQARQTIPQLEVSVGDEDCAMVVRHLEPLVDEDAAALSAFADATGIRVWLQPKGPDTVHALGDGPEELEYRLPDENITIRFLPRDFIQVNGGLNRKMIRQAMDLLTLDRGHKVLDLFCGLGNFTLPLARHADSVLGLESDEGLLERARANAALNQLDNVEFAHADLYADAPAGQWPRGSFDRVLLDPPRTGAIGILDLLAGTGAQKIVYVSCNPETLARDADALVRLHGYRLAAAGVMDMFPHTAHMESMALFERAK